MNRKCDWFVQLMIRFNIHGPAVLLAMCVFVVPLRAQRQAAAAQFSDSESPQAMEERTSRLEAEVAELKSVVKQLQSASSLSVTAASFLPAAVHSSNETAVESTPVAARQNQDNAMQVQDRKVLDFFRDT